MKLTHALGAFLLLSCATPAHGQSYPGEKSLNPLGLRRGYLLYRQPVRRHVGNLLAPGGAAIVIHRTYRPSIRLRARRARLIIPPADTLTTPATTVAALRRHPRPAKPAPTRGRRRRPGRTHPRPRHR